MHTALLTLVATVIGGLIAAGASLVPQFLAHRYRVKTALRMLRDDFYAGQAKIAYTMKENQWWDETLELPALATPEDITVISGKVDGKAWKSISGTRRHFRQLQEQRKAGHPIPPRASLRNTYKLLEYSRRDLYQYDKKMEYEKHSQYDVIRALALGAPDEGIRSGPEAPRDGLV
jgi:hypothetical protein